MSVATKLLKAIDTGLEADGGNLFRHHLRYTMAACEDAYRADDGMRGHLGASLLGTNCARALWYGFRWAGKGQPQGRMMRIWNRGHLEEARFAALLQMVGVQMWTHTADGKQFRVNICDSHSGGSCDGVVLGVPDCPTVPLLAEFKTHKDSTFNELVKKGVKLSKPQHYVQMNLYMVRMQTQWALYGAVNKDTDQLHFELVQYDPQCDSAYTERARQIVYATNPPPRISSRPSWFECKFCDFAGICHSGKEVLRTCRTCRYVQVKPDGWHCGAGQHVGPMGKEQQLAACGHYTKLDTLARG